MSGSDGICRKQFYTAFLERAVDLAVNRVIIQCYWNYKGAKPEGRILCRSVSLIWSWGSIFDGKEIDAILDEASTMIFDSPETCSIPVLSCKMYGSWRI